MIRKTATALVAFAAAGSVLLGGTALAGKDNDRNNFAGDGGDGGHAKTECWSLIPVGASVGLLGKGGDAVGQQCNATGGAGGAGGDVTTSEY